ncbi:MAG: hypothetical protein JSS91_00840 [Bacteroidetes bacterium]|nr:hypothetical protein [Bacteroidota bacterium]
MDGRSNNKGNKGNKGGIGRPSLIDEQTRALVLNKSWDRIKQILESKTVSETEKDSIAFELVKRSIPQKIDHTSNGNDINFGILTSEQRAKLDKLLND